MAKFKTVTGLVLGSATLALSWCPLALAMDGQPIRPGEKVQINYVCRLNDGAVAAATYRDAAIPSEDRRSAIYQALKNDAPIELAAGQAAAADNPGKPFDFADAIATRLGQAATGMPTGKVQTVEIAAREFTAKPGSTINLARVRRRPMELRMTAEEYRQRTGKEPVIGNDMTFDPTIPGKVTAVDGEEVLIRFKATVGSMVDTPFGAALVKTDGRSYLLEIQAQKGALVRSGAMVGRIVEVNERTFSIDYSHPLAGEDLACEITVIRTGDSAQEGQDS